MVELPWYTKKIVLPLPDTAHLSRLEPFYPQSITREGLLSSLIQNHLNAFRMELKKAKEIVLILEDPSRVSKTGIIVNTICQTVQKCRGSLLGFEIIIASGAHFHAREADLLKKVGSSHWPVSIHNCLQNNQPIGTSRSGIPLLFNQKVVRADFRMTISTMNIHPLAGLSGGAKILLPGVAGLKTIEAFHSLPGGIPGTEKSPMRILINELLGMLPIAHSWHLLSNPEGEIYKIIGGDMLESFHQAATELLKIVTVRKPEQLADFLILGCRPFNQNLIGAFKSFHPIPKLLKPGGSVLLFNEAPQGIGFHHWRTQAQVITGQKKEYQKRLEDFHVGIFSPGTSCEEFASLFPGTFHLLKTQSDLVTFFNGPNTYPKVTTSSRFLVIPYAPVTLVSD